MAVIRMRMTVAYDGSGFHGFAAQPGVSTVAGALIDALATVTSQTVTLTAAGRTDAGVHAWGQVVSFDLDGEEGVRGGPDPERIQRSLNGLLAPAIAVRSLAVAEAGFDARRSARARRYRYTVLNRPEPDPFLARTSWHVPAPLDLVAMRLACDPVIGEHDFSSFCRAPRRVPEASLVREVLDARWYDLGEGVLRFDISARAFCHQMVRALVGSMVAMGMGRRRAGEMAAILRARSRAAAVDLAPPQGLCLWEVVYA
jgi:tRNA pseudouridine38-40 synthase